MQQKEHGVSPLLSPWVLGSMAILALNDHLLKAAYPGWFTGKLSDFAGLIFFPVVLDWLIGSRRIAVWATGGVFLLVKATPFGNDLWKQTISEIYGLAGIETQIQLHADKTDLIAMVALLLPLYRIAPFSRSNGPPITNQK